MGNALSKSFISVYRAPLRNWAIFQYGNGMQSDYRYDALNRLKSRETTRHSGQNTSSVTRYQYDEVSNLLGITDQRTEQDKKTIAKELGIENQYSELDQTRFYDYDNLIMNCTRTKWLKAHSIPFWSIVCCHAKNTSDPIWWQPGNLTLRRGFTSTGEDKRYNRQSYAQPIQQDHEALTHALVAAGVLQLWSLKATSYAQGINNSSGIMRTAWSKSITRKTKQEYA